MSSASVPPRDEAAVARPGQAPAGRRFSADLIFPILLGAAFIFVVVGGRGLPRGAGSFPIVLGLLGLALLAVYVGREVYFARRARQSGTARTRLQILDLASRQNEVSRRDMGLRTVRVFGGLLALLAGVWLVSFHVAVPVYLLVYLRSFAKTSWRLTLGIAVAFELIIVVFYGLIVHVPWGESLVESIGGFSFQEILGNPIQPLLPF